MATLVLDTLFNFVGGLLAILFAFSPIWSGKIGQRVYRERAESFRHSFAALANAPQAGDCLLLFCKFLLSFVPRFGGIA
jgi:hypothetical protein